MTLDSQTYQTLVSTRVEHPLSDDERAALVERLSDDGILSENQAEWLVRRHGQQQSAQEIADALGVTRSRVYNLEDETSAKLTRIDATLDGISDLREWGDDWKPDSAELREGETRDGDGSHAARNLEQIQMVEDDGGDENDE
jgi:predicted DNA-binding protein YlxM (UPF0122 family)